MTKHEKYFKDMITQNKNLFDRFRMIHDKYSLDPKSHQKEFNEIGYEVQDVVRKYENLLCGHSESSGFGKFSTKLADKFQAEVKALFPKINMIGMIME